MRTAAALAALLVLTVGIYWKLTLSDRYTWLENPDHSLLIRPWLDYEAREVHAGRIPLWDPYLWGGQSLIAQLEPGVANPFNWPLFLWPLRDGHISLGALHWYWVLIHWVAAAFCYWLCRDLKCGTGASLLGASIYAFAGYVGWTGTTCFLMSCLWVPVALLFLARVFRGERPVANAALCGAALGAGFLMGHHNVPIYLVVLTGGLWVWVLARRWRERRFWTAAAVCLAIWLMVSAVQALPTIEYGRQALRWVGLPEPLHWNDPVPYSVHAEYSLMARSLPGMLVPGLGVHANTFVGIVAVALAFAAIRWRWKSPDVRLLSMVALFGLLLALGKDTPVHWLAYKLIPMVEKARYPAMAVVISQCAVAALAAQGLSLPRETLRKLALPLAVFGVSGLALYAAMDRFGRVPAGHPAWVVAVVALALALVVRRLNAAPAAVLALFLVEVAIYPPAILRPRDVPGSYASLIASQSDIAGFLKRQPGWFRVEVDEDAVPYNFGDLYGIEQFGGYVPAMPERLHRIAAEQTTPRLYGIQYRVARAPSNPSQVEVFQSRSGLRVFRDPRIGEPLWAAHDQECAAPDRFRIVSRVPNTFVLDVDLGCAGLVVTGDPFYRGWRAWIDGGRVPIREYIGGVRAVRAGAGSHRIVFRYIPVSVYAGSVVTFVGLVFATTLARRRV